MKKIFKYQINEGDLSATMPERRTTIRVDRVDDGYYSGCFLWAIVDPEDELVTQRISKKEQRLLFKDKEEEKKLIGRYYKKKQIAVKERQSVILDGPPVFAHEDDGKLFIYYWNRLFNKKIDYEIVVYKTGQEIKEKEDDLFYLGLNRLWIMQELGLYTFVATK